MMNILSMLLNTLFFTICINLSNSFSPFVFKTNLLSSTISSNNVISNNFYSRYSKHIFVASDIDREEELFAALQEEFYASNEEVFNDDMKGKKK